MIGYWFNCLPGKLVIKIQLAVIACNIYEDGMTSGVVGFSKEEIYGLPKSIAEGVVKGQSYLYELDLPSNTFKLVQRKK